MLRSICYIRLNLAWNETQSILKHVRHLMEQTAMYNE
jgi:hypothetical protein